MRFFEPGQRVVLASNNPGKLAEIQSLLAALPIEIVSQAALGVSAVEETGASFEANSLLKARHASTCTGLAAIADDSGLEVFALGGQPGVKSARFAGPEASDRENNQKLLQALTEVVDQNRGARFHCVVCAVREADDPAPIVCHGTWEGRIAWEPRGANGFGYDPLFYIDEQRCTSAELPSAIKNRISHRARAFAKFINELQRD